jgi:hypothetical protein
MDGEIEIDFDDLDTRTLQKAIIEIFRCIQNSKGQVPDIVTYGEEVLTIELDNKRFRVEIKDVRRFQ